MSYNKDRELPPDEFTHDWGRMATMEGPLVSEEKVKSIHYQKVLSEIPTMEMIKALELRGHVIEIDKLLNH